MAKLIELSTTSYFHVCLVIAFMTFCLIVAIILCTKSCLKQQKSKTSIEKSGACPENEEGLWYEDIANRTTLLNKITLSETNHRPSASGDIELRHATMTKENLYENVKTKSDSARYLNVHYGETMKVGTTCGKSKDAGTTRYTNVIIGAI
ncbi:unnamed protein product [Lymnaea stagnalis]|uniref:Uncharacterized protein n=1 Tax=Lymnaea stagnalis TaxID=6523 RepID=A0AAV2IDX2_LYMST